MCDLKSARAETSVLLVGNLFSQTLGTSSVCEDLARRLSARGWSVVATSPEPERLRRVFDMLCTTWRRRIDYEVAHVDVYSGAAFVWAEAVCFILRRAGKPYVLALRGGNLPDFARRAPDRVRRLLKTAHAVTTPSAYLLEQMTPYHDDLRLQPNPIDIAAYDFRIREHATPRIMWLRAFHSIYNPSLAPRVINRLVREFPDLRLTMIGPDKRDGSLEAMRSTAERERIGRFISTPGGVPKSSIASWLNRGDIFLNTTNIDNTPVSVLEAMACGLCVVSTNVGGMPYLLEHEHDALLVEPDDPEMIFPDAPPLDADTDFEGEPAPVEERGNEDPGPAAP